MYLAAIAVDPPADNWSGILAILTVITAPAAALLGVLISGWISSRNTKRHREDEREHWLREKRLDAYVQMLAITERMRGGPTRDARDRLTPEETKELADRVLEIGNTLYLINPRSTDEKISDYVNALDEHDDAAADDARIALIDEMRAALGVKDAG